MSERPKTSVGAAIARAFAIAVVMLACLELMLRLVAPAASASDLYDNDPLLFWRMKANVKNLEQKSAESSGEHLVTHISTNALGMRDEEIADRSAGELRVLVMGDSSIFGHGVELQDTFVKQLEAKLRKAEPTRTIHVYNGGVSGYSSFQGRILFAELLPKIKPDAVILAYYFSDVIPDAMPDRARVPPADATSALGRLLSKSSIYQFIRDEMQKRANDRADHGGALVARVTVEEYKDNMRSMVESATAQGARCMFLLLDPRADPVPPEQKPYREALRDLAAERKVPLVDMEGPFTHAANRAALFLDDVHPSPTGNVIIAEHLAATLKTVTP